MMMQSVAVTRLFFDRIFDSFASAWGYSRIRRIGWLVKILFESSIPLLWVLGGMKHGVNDYLLIFVFIKYREWKTPDQCPMVALVYDWVKIRLSINHT